MLNTKLFTGEEYDLTVYNEQALINESFRFYSVSDCDGTETEFDFPEFAGAYFRVYNERLGREIKDLVLTISGAYLVANTSVADMTFDDNGNYYYEIGYVRNVYDQVLRYGKLIVI